MQSHVKSFVYLLVQRGQFTTAVRPIGASEALRARLCRRRQDNEERLIAKARARLEIELEAAAFARFAAEGAALDDAALFATVQGALAKDTEELR